MPARKYTYDHPRPALTVDIAIVTQSTVKQIMLIKRKGYPFTGSWALPGGFVDMDETLEDAARRELEEETGISNPKMKLTQIGIFDAPGRDPRGRVISVVYLARVKPAELAPRAGDDAAAASWFPLSKPPPLAFDHAEILAAVRRNLR